MAKAIDRTGHRYVRLLVLYEANRQPKEPRKWVCKCDCGTIKAMIIKPRTKSCGCLAKEINANREHVHGEHGSRLYNIWHSMKQRCQNQNSDNYSYYGALGIEVCAEWQHFTGFLSWAKTTNYSDNLTLDRIDGTKDYHPGNCRWASKTTQARNQKKRNTNSSGFTGVNYLKKTGKWVSSIMINYKKVHLGCYLTIQEAVDARNQYIINNNLGAFPIQ